MDYPGSPAGYPVVNDRSGDHRRIVPTPSAKSRRLTVVLSAGIVVAALAAGAGGYFIGRAGQDSSQTPKQTAGQAPNPGALPAYEASQLTINKAKLSGELAPLAEPWLTTAGICLANGELDGPKLGVDERRHVFCRYSAVSLHFVVFISAAQKDNARTFRSQLNLSGDGIAPGIEAAGRKNGGVTKAAGKYVEYAYRDTAGRAYCGIWWDRDDDANGALLIETLCEEGLGGKWDPLRDLWQRHS